MATLARRSAAASAAVEQASVNVKQRQRQLLHAEGQLEAVKGAKALALRGAQRIRDLSALIEALHGPRTDAATDVADRFAPFFYSAFAVQLWADPSLTFGQAVDLALEHTVELLPSMSPAMRSRLRRRPPGNFSNKQVADALGVTWELRQELRLIQIAACDLTDAEFKAKRAALDNEKGKARAARKRRAEGRPTAEERRIRDAQDRAALAAAAALHNKSVATIRRWINEGKLADPRPCKSELCRNREGITAEATFAFSDVGERGRFKAPPTIPFGTVASDPVTLELNTSRNTPATHFAASLGSPVDRVVRSAAAALALTFPDPAALRRKG